MFSGLSPSASILPARTQMTVGNNNGFAFLISRRSNRQILLLLALHDTPDCPLFACTSRTLQLVDLTDRHRLCRIRLQLRSFVFVQTLLRRVPFGGALVRLHGNARQRRKRTNRGQAPALHFIVKMQLQIAAHALRGQSLPHLSERLLSVFLPDFTRAITCLTKFGDDIDFVITPALLKLSTVNSARSAFCVFNFEPGFFSTFVVGNAASNGFSINAKVRPLSAARGQEIDAECV